jgi:hypothetical protein
MHEAERIMRSIGDDSAVPQLANIAAEIECAAGNWEGAIQIVEAFFVLAASAAGKWNAQEIAYLHQFLAACSAVAGKIDAAATSARIYYSFWREVRDITMTFSLVDTFGAVAVSRGRPESAARLLGGADALYATGGMVRVRVPQRVHDLTWEAAEKIQSQSDFRMNHGVGMQFSFDEICAEIDAVLAS